jgi:hypothetical protein
METGSCIYRLFSVQDIITKWKNNEIVIPNFQRDDVWKKANKVEFLKICIFQPHMQGNKFETFLTKSLNSLPV